MSLPTFLHPFAKPSSPTEHFIEIVRGEGALVFDRNGKQYVDGMASLWYANIGHGRTEMVEAVAAQMSKIAAYNCFDPFTNGPSEEVTVKIAGLADHVASPRVFLTSSGSESVDTAIKLARIAHAQAGHPERQMVLSRGRGYHGATYGGVSAQGIPANQAGFGALLPDFVNVPGDDLEAMALLFSEHGPRIAAVITEPVQGAGGVWPPVEGYLEGLRKLCDQHGAYLIVDEVICAFGRLGRWFGTQRYGIAPDLITFAKGITSGYIPMGGVVVAQHVHEALSSDPNFMLRHGFTYSGHPTASAAALANLAIIEREDLLSRAVHMGARLEAGLRSLVADGILASIRGDTAVWAATLNAGLDPAVVRNKMLERGAIARPLPPDTLAFCPPLVTTDEQIDHLVDALATSID